MQYYFRLQYLRMSRFFSEAGILPVLGFVLGFLIFFILSKLLFIKTVYAPYLYLMILVSVIMKVRESNKERVAEVLFSQADFMKLRVTENLLLTFPFLVYLAYEGCFAGVAVALVAALLLGIIKNRLSSSFVIPTPFKKLPFEFIVGFRRYLVLIIVLYFLITKAIQVHNPNLALVSYGALILSLLAYYFTPEDKYFVWIANRTSQQFLTQKMCIAFIGTVILCLPMLVLIAIAFYDKVWLLLIIHAIGSILLVCLISMKYSAFPKEINLLQVIIFALCLWFPPALLIALPIFWKKAQFQLDQILP